MKIVGVNGFGRIGRYFTRISLDSKDVDVTIVNDIADIQTLAHLFKYDSVHRQLKHKFTIEGNQLIFENGKKITFISERNPENIPWGKYGVDTVLESTGLFLSMDEAERHIKGGAKKVIISAPAKNEDVKTVVLGVNEEIIEDSDLVISNASCTTNNAAPMIMVMRRLCEIESVFITTVHSYTSDQRLHDSPHKDLRRARAAAESIVPTSTGAAKAISRIFPDLEGKMGGSGVRVPVPDGSLTDITLVVKNPPSAEQINEAMKEAANSYLKGIMDFTDEPIVSIDIVGNPNSCVFDAELTSVIGNMVKIVGWYDNEAGYSNRCLELAAKF